MYVHTLRSSIKGKDFENIVKNSDAMIDFNNDIFMKIPELDYKVSLRDGEFPFMKDRTLLPILVYDTLTGKGYYNMAQDYAGSSYKKNRGLTYWDWSKEYMHVRRMCIVGPLLNFSVGTYSRQV